MELHLLNASFASRASLYLILDYLNVKNYSREFAILITKIKDYYDRDPDTPAVSRELFLNLLEESVTNPKHFERFKLLVDEALLIDSSVQNVNELIVRGKLHEVGLKLSAALSNNEDDKAAKLMEEYRELQSVVTLEELDQQGIEVFSADDIDRILEHSLSGEGLLKVYPLALSERLDHRLGGGHHLTLFARPEMGKTALCLTVAGGFARQGAAGLYLLNEDRTEDVYIRQISNLTGLTRQQIMENPGKAKELAMQRGLGNIRFISMSPGNERQLNSFVDKFDPSWIVVDQVRNLDMKESNKVLQLEKAVVAVRNIAKKADLIAVSVTQAGDSGEGKRLLEMGDIDYSNTGVPSQADVLAGLGGTREDVEKGMRFINLSKNKIGGRHESFPIKLRPEISRYVSISEAA